MISTTHPNRRLVICICNEGYDVSLERRKLYEAIEDPEATDTGQIRVIDESGEDYLFPKEYFVAVDLPATTVQAVLEAI